MCCHYTEMSNFETKLSKIFIPYNFQWHGEKKRDIIEDTGFRICTKDAYNKAITEEALDIMFFFYFFRSSFLKYSTNKTP